MTGAMPWIIIAGMLLVGAWLAVQETKR